jgi:hypothetical protein
MNPEWMWSHLNERVVDPEPSASVSSPHSLSFVELIKCESLNTCFATSILSILTLTDPFRGLIALESMVGSFDKSIGHQLQSTLALLALEPGHLVKQFK